MKKLNLILPFIILGLLLTSCGTTNTSVITGSDFNENTNTTNYFVLPYGSVDIPGKWNKAHYNSVSNQQFFVNNDSIEIAVSFNRYDKIEFNADGSKKGFECVKGFYEWDSQYMVETYGLKRELIESDSSKLYLIFRIFGESGAKVYNSYFLIGEKSGNISNMSISHTKKWDEDEKTSFLKKLFLVAQ